MARVDSAWFRMDVPENTADVVALLTFRAPPPFARLRRLVEERLLSYPRFRQRAVRASWLGRDAWEDDTRFALDHHLVRRRLSTDDPRAIRELVGAIATEPLDPGRPLWRIYLVSAPSSGAIVAKIHHCLGDGFALVALLLAMTDEPAGEPEPARHSMGAYRRLEPWLHPGAMARSMIREPARAFTLGAEAAALAAALTRMTAYPADPETDLANPLTGRRHVAWSHAIPLATARGAARERGVTVNDLVLAAVAGALRRQLAEAGAPVDGLRLRALVPVNLRPGPPEVTLGSMGNRFGLAYLELPTDVAGSRARLEAIHQRTLQMKARPDAIVAFGILGAIGWVPAVAPLASRFFSRKASVVITNVPGPRQHVHLARRRVESAMFWVPHPATLGVGISVLTYAGEIRIGVRADEAVMPRPDAFVARFERELSLLGVIAARRPAAGRPSLNGRVHRGGRASGTPSP